MNQAKIKKNELTADLKTMLKDEFVAEITENDSALKLRFLNGQKFVLTITEE